MAPLGENTDMTLKWESHYAVLTRMCWASATAGVSPRASREVTEGRQSWNITRTLATEIATELGSTRWDENRQETISRPEKPDDPPRFGMSRYVAGQPQPNKKIAAGVTLLVLTCYLLISGAAIPTERAFVMNGLVFAAIMIDRLRISMRVCAIAAAIVLVIDPSVLVGVSFQMSFGAVVALIAVYEAYGTRLGRLLHGRSVSEKALGYYAGVVVTTVIVTLGTYPYSIYHFHHIALFSPLANVIAVPLSAIWTLPWGVVTCLLMPLGLERLALVPMGWGIDITIWVAQHVSALPGNVWMMPPLPAEGLLLISLGGLWLCLWQGSWRRCGAVAIAAGAATMLLTRPPDILIADGGRFLAARASDGHYFVSADKSEKVVRSFFATETGEILEAWPAASSGAESGLDCADGLCRYSTRGRTVAIVTHATALPVRCRGLDAIVSQVPTGFHCRSMMPVIDRIDSWRRGAVALWLDRDGVTVESVNESRGDRPWVPHPRPIRAADKHDPIGKPNDQPT